MNSKLLVNDSIRSGMEEVDEYIELLESVIIAYTTNNASRMLAEANRVIGILADDMSIIAEGGSMTRTKLIKEEKNNMAMDRIVLLLKQTDVISNVSRKSVDIGKKIAYDLHVSEEETVVPLEDTEEEKEEKVSKEMQDILDEKDLDLISGVTPAIEQIMMDYKGRNKK